VSASERGHYTESGNVYQLVLVPPSPSASLNHGVSGAIIDLPNPNVIRSKDRDRAGMLLYSNKKEGKHVCKNI
jgi:hypothetical protein